MFSLKSILLDISIASLLATCFYFFGMPFSSIFLSLKLELFFSCRQHRDKLLCVLTSASRQSMLKVIIERCVLIAVIVLLVSVVVVVVFFPLVSLEMFPFLCIVRCLNYDMPWRFSGLISLMFYVRLVILWVLLSLIWIYFLLYSCWRSGLCHWIWIRLPHLCL